MSASSTPGDFDHQSVQVATIASVIVSCWSKGTIPNPNQMALALAGQPRESLSAYNILENWPAALTVAKFIACTTGLPIPKGAHTS